MPIATVIQTSATKPPTLTAGKLTPEIVREFEECCISYFDAKLEIEPKDYVRRIGGSLHDRVIADWYGTNRVRFCAMAFEDFISELKNKWLPDDWQGDIRRRILGAKHTGAFYEWAMTLRGLNTLLHGTDHHLSDVTFINQLEANLEPGLGAVVREEKVKPMGDIDAWMDAVKVLDDRERHKCDQQEEAIRAHLKRTGALAGLSEPSRRYNTFRQPTNTAGASNSASGNAFVRLPKLTDSEHALLNQHDGCCKCRRFYASHKSDKCPNGFPSGENYKQLTAADAELAKKRANAKPVAAVTMSSIVEVSSPAHTVAAVLGSGSFSAAAVMPSNRSSIIDGSDSDASRDVEESVSSLPRASVPFSISHLQWKCTAISDSSGSNLMLNGLIDNGSHTVLVNAGVVNRLGLRLHLLPSPMNVELAMSSPDSVSDSKSVARLTHWVKLKLYDTENRWAAKTVRAVVANGLCTDIILGLPFLAVNRLVIDHCNRTCIDPKTGFDLLNPKTVSAENKRKIERNSGEKMFKPSKWHELMIEEFKLKQQTRWCEPLQVNNTHVVAVIRSRIEKLAYLEQLKLLGYKVRKEYSDVFEPIPHIDKLSKDVYCTIKLKDPSIAITSRHTHVHAGTEGHG
jgi:hypothetical protein